MKYPASLSKTCIAALFLFSAGPALAAPVPCEGEESEIVGLVVAANGVAKAFREGESEPRSLACNDAIHACEIVVTEPGAEVGIKTGEVYAHVAGGSQLQVSSADGGAILALRSGSFRLIDPREAGSPAVQVRTPHLTTAAQGTDTEFFVNAGETSSRLCNHLASLDVASTGGGSSLVLDAGCAVSSGAAVSELASAEPTIAIQDAPSCEVEVAKLLDPIDIGPIGPALSFPQSGAADAFNRKSCEATGCGVKPTPTPTPTPTPNPRPRPRPKSRILVDPDPDAGFGGPGFPPPTP